MPVGGHARAGETGEDVYIKVHRGRGRYEHVGTFRLDEHGGKRAARRAAERAEADAHERRRNRKSVETCDEFAAHDYPIVKHGPTRGQRKSDKTLRGYRDELKPFVREFRGIRLADVDRPAARRYANAHPRSAVGVRNMFSDAVDDGLIDANPFANVQLEQGRGRSQHPTITEKELHDLADAAVVVLGGGYGQVYRSFILATGYIGCRLNEGLNASTATCGPRARGRPACYEVLEAADRASAARGLGCHPDDSAPGQARARLVREVRGPLTKGNHQSLWTPVRALWCGKLSNARRRELVDFDWHSLRRFMAHFFYIVRGYGPEPAAYQLGHTDPNLVIRRYGKRFQGALDRLNARRGGRRSSRRATRGIATVPRDLRLVPGRRTAPGPVRADPPLSPTR